MEQKWILYLEDEEDLAQEVIAELREFGIKVTHCLDYSDGVIKANNQKFDLFIVDIHLKKGTGDKIIQMIKGNLHHVNYKTPMLVASSQITSQLVHTIGRDIEYALVKPFDLDALLENVFKILQISPYNYVDKK